MKLKQLLITAFIVLTFIPTVVIMILLYKSSYSLSKESYTNNMTESIKVQADYISQTIEDRMISDYRFADRYLIEPAASGVAESQGKEILFSAFESYLENSEDKIAVSLLLDNQNKPVYTIGEKIVLDIVLDQLTAAGEYSRQTVSEFKLEDGVYSIGIVTPIWDKDSSYRGCLVSVYDDSYIFKIISSYYEVADTSTYMCRADGTILNYRGLNIENQDEFAELISNQFLLSQSSVLDTRIGSHAVSASFRNIRNTPWYLTGLLDHSFIFTNINNFIPVYLLIIFLVVIIDIILAVYMSQKVVEPINRLIRVMEEYESNLDKGLPEFTQGRGYVETRFLYKQFYSLMKALLLVRHNFEGVYRLYQSNAMDDTNIDIDVKNQVVYSSKAVFQELMDELILPEGSCVVERFSHCFCESDQKLLMNIFEKMRDEHLSVTTEAEIYSPHFGEKWFHILVVPMYEEARLCRIFVQLRDISGFKKKEFKSNEQVRKDSLTGLYNRIGFTEQVNLLMSSGCAGRFHSLLFIDMNYFKMVNDNFGHAEGDELLRSIGHAIQKETGTEGVASRFGGDEFAVFLPCTTVEKTEEIRDKISRRLVYPYKNDQIKFVVSASVGVSICNEDSPKTLESMLDEADTSMYQVKREFKLSDSVM